MIFKAIRAAIVAVINMVLGLLGSCIDCVRCCLPCLPIPDGDDVMEAVMDFMKGAAIEHIKNFLHHPAGSFAIPAFVVNKIVDRLDPMFDRFDENMDCGEPHHRNHQDHQQAPEQEYMDQRYVEHVDQDDIQMHEVEEE